MCSLATKAFWAIVLQKTFWVICTNIPGSYAENWVIILQKTFWVIILQKKFWVIILQKTFWVILQKTFWVTIQQKTHFGLSAENVLGHQSAQNV